MTLRTAWVSCGGLLDGVGWGGRRGFRVQPTGQHITRRGCPYIAPLKRAIHVMPPKLPCKPSPYTHLCAGTQSTVQHDSSQQHVLGPHMGPGPTAPADGTGGDPVVTLVRDAGCRSNGAPGWCMYRYRYWRHRRTAVHRATLRHCGDANTVLRVPARTGGLSSGDGEDEGASDGEGEEDDEDGEGEGEDGDLGIMADEFGEGEDDEDEDEEDDGESGLASRREGGKGRRGAGGWRCAAARQRAPAWADRESED